MVGKIFLYMPFMFLNSCSVISTYAGNSLRPRYSSFYAVSHIFLSDADRFLWLTSVGTSLEDRPTAETWFANAVANFRFCLFLMIVLKWGWPCTSWYVFISS